MFCSKELIKNSQKWFKLNEALIKKIEKKIDFIL